MKKVTHPILSDNKKSRTSRKKKTVKAVPKISRTEVEKRLHELQMQLAKLKKQNKKLSKANKDIEKSREHYRVLVEQAPIGITVHQNEKYIYFNPAADRMLGGASKKMIGKHINTLIHPDFHGHVKAQVKQIINQGRTQPMHEMKYLKVDGTMIDVEVQRISTMYEGQPTVYAIWSDITEHKQTREALAENEECLKGIMKSAMDGIITVDADQTIILFNPTAEKMFGYSASEIIGQPLNLLLPADIHAIHQKHVQQFGESKTTTRGMYGFAEVSALRSNSEIFPIEASISQFDVNGKKFFTAIVRDITKRKQAEAALRETEERYRIMVSAEKSLLRTLIDNLPLNIYIKDRNSRKTLANRAEYQFLGFKSEAEVLNKDEAELYPAESANHSIEEDQQVFNTGEPILAKETINTRKDGSTRYFLTYKMPLKDDLENTLGLLGISYDITDRKLAELMVKQKNEELLIAKEKAQENERLKTAFLANMSHELRTPLTGILGSAEYLATKIQEPKLNRFIENISNAGKTLLTLINDILDLSKIEAGKIQITETEINVPELIQELSSIFSVTQKNDQVEFHVVISPLPVIVIIDGIRLRQILYNLLGNAFKFTNRGSITLTVSHTENHQLIIEVKDTGIGIPEDQQELIFEPFRQQDKQSHAKYGGTGLGLSISKRLAEAMRGTITLESKRKVGSTFTVTVPYHFNETK